MLSCGKEILMGRIFPHHHTTTSNLQKLRLRRVPLLPGNQSNGDVTGSVVNFAVPICWELFFAQFHLIIPSDCIDFNPQLMMMLGGEW